VCRSQQKSVFNIDNTSMSDRAYGESDSEYCGNTDYCIDMVSAHSLHLPDRAFAFVSLGPNKTPIKFKIDTGS
jgi:hypothetical protein